MALLISTWLWGKKYGPDDVARLASGVRRHLKQDHRFVCFSETPLHIEGVESGLLLDPALTKIPGCYARLRMFDSLWQEAWFSDRIVCIDLDTVITGPLDPLFDRPEPFVILHGGNASNPCPYNGALMMLRVGAHPEVWSDFSLEAARKVPFDSFPDDQGWLWHKIPDAAGWKCGPESGAYVFRKPGWPGFTNLRHAIPDDSLPDGARLVTFSGWRNPHKFQHLDWIRRNWR